jgi:uncharacterized protein (TIGR03067 family)
MDQPVPAQAPSQATLHSRQWGLAALLLSCFLIFLTPIFGIAAGAGAALGALSTPKVSEHTLREYGFLAKLAVCCLIGAAALALVFGLLGLRSALSRHQPVGLAVAATSVAVIALLLQVLLLFFCIYFEEDMIRVKKDWYDPVFEENRVKRNIPSKKDLEKLQGTWYTVSTSYGDTNTGEDKTDTITYEGDKYIQKRGGQFWQAGTFKIVDATSNPKQIDYLATEGEFKGTHWRSIYTLDGPDHQICSDDGNDNRPKEFSGKVGFHRVTKRQQ